ncbi:rubredoxin [Candidatus Woesearchaeota archaeon]|nr:rubredoxin [Candidatus Woesearchaeota archaeon]
MEQFQCKRCDYEFELAKKPNKCPYCGKEGTIGPLKSAQDFLDEE